MPLPPLVEPGDPLSKEQVERYSRHLLIPQVGSEGQRRLSNAKVLVIGAGGLGSPVLLYLAAAGVGTIGIVEYDTVETSNLQRQIIHTRAEVGRPKAESAREAIWNLNEFVDVQLHEFALTRDNAVELFERYDLIIDGTDNFATRYLVNDAAVLAHRPYVWGSIYRFSGQISVFWEDAPDERGITYRDLYPEPPAAGTVPSCAEGGVLGVICGSVGSVMATEAVKLITGIGEPLLGRLMVYDALTMDYRTVKLARDPDREPIEALVDYEAFCGVPVLPAQSADGEITPRQLDELLRGPGPLAVIDVREPGEYAMAHLPGAVNIPQGAIVSGEALGELPGDQPIVFYCKGGVRSANAMAAARAAGFAQTRSLQGGILAWADQIDPSIPKY